MTIAKNWAPKCCLPFCESRVDYQRQGRKADGSPVFKWKVFCNKHRNALKHEVEEFKDLRGCENRSGYLGWICRDPYNKSLTIDHHDGNKLNTNKENIKVLCANCHQEKTKVFGDHLKKYSYVNPMAEQLFEGF